MNSALRSAHADADCVRVEDLRYTYQGEKQKVEAVQGLSFKAQRGRITGILGPNGSGKSTTFRILSTQLAPSQGEAWINGFSVLHARARVREQMGVTFQSPSLDPLFTVQENLEVHAALYGLSGRAAQTRITELLKLFHLQDRRDSRVKILSGGLARRAELAKTLLHKPSVLLMDEPTTGLDPRARLEFWAELRRLRDEGMSILVTTHLMDEADCCDELLFLNEGRRAAQGTPAELKKEFGCDVVIAEVPHAEKHLADIQQKVAAGDRVQLVDGKVRVETRESTRVFALLQGILGSELLQLSVGRPTLGDVYLSKTGQKL